MTARTRSTSTSRPGGQEQAGATNRPKERKRLILKKKRGRENAGDGEIEREGTRKRVREGEERRGGGRR